MGLYKLDKHVDASHTSTSSLKFERASERDKEIDGENEEYK